jgi:cell fate regulator YaaT (PSP1 superfamily)
MPSDFIELTFKGERKKICANPVEINFRIGDYALCETDNGLDMGLVSKLGRIVSIMVKDENLSNIARKATEKDLEKLKSNRELEKEAFKQAREKIEHHGLIMKLVDAEYQFDRNKLTFYFTADKRVDFRALVKDLAARFKTRIELRQIGVRDEARRIGGYGICGHHFCCTKFITEFAPISAQYAKEQNLPMNPVKLSGVCGRLMCCLAFERDFYKEALKNFPDPGTVLKTDNGRVYINKVDIFKNSVTLCFRDEDDEIREIKLKEYQELAAGALSIEKKKENHSFA